MQQEFDREETASRLMIRAIRAWHFQPDQWRLGAEDDARTLAGTQAPAALSEFNALMEVVSRTATRDVMLRPLPCRRQSPDEQALLSAYDCAVEGDVAGCRAALTGFMAGDGLEQAARLLVRLAQRFAAPLEGVEAGMGSGVGAWAAALPAGATLH